MPVSKFANRKPVAHQNATLVDPFGRKLDYLRIALTDRCNLRCLYCMPEEGIPLVSHADILTYEELQRLLSIFADLGIRKVRFTGGEPFARQGALSFLKRVKHIPGIEHIHLTTNGVYPADIMDELIRLEISGINLSLDSLKKKRFKQITRRDYFEKVWQTFDRALQSDIPLKVNMVVQAGINDDEIKAFAELARQHKIQVRFIEQMPFNGSAQPYIPLPAGKILDRLQASYPEIIRIEQSTRTARLYRIPGFRGKIGIIGAFTRNFCGRCNRLRLTADGKLQTCLYDRAGLDLQRLLRTGKSDPEIVSAIRSAVALRAIDGFAAEARSRSETVRSMAQIGG